MKRDEPLLLENQLCFAIYAASHAFTRAYRPLLVRLGITYPQYLVMLVLWKNGSTHVGAISRLLRLDSGTLTPLLKRLETAGLILRRRDKSDERMVVIELTNKGQEARIEARLVADGIGEAAGCTKEEFTSLHRDINALAARLDCFSVKRAKTVA